MGVIRFHPIHGEAFAPHLTMRELEDQRVRWVVWITLIFWISNFLLSTLGTALEGNPHLGPIAATRLGTTLLGLAFCFFIHLLLRRLSTTRKRLIALAIVAPIAAETFAWARFFAEAAVDPSLSLHNFTWSGAVRTISFYTWFFLAWAGFYLAVSYSFDVREEQRRTAEIRERAHLAQLRALHSQINPHFLFNSLNSVSALILDGKVALADQMVTKLAQFLRLGLAADPSHKIRLSSELELQRTYLSIEQLRYEDLRVSFDVPEELLSAKVPALILQPIIENAVKYGVASAPPPATIAIKAWSAAPDLHIQITDSGKSSASKSTGAGIGLSNVLQRLRLIYGEDRAKLDATKLADGSFQVELAFPLELE
jgi:two-component system, LytTR family, sensor kinase